MNAPGNQSPAAKRAVLPMNVARCRPSSCAQECSCARANDPVPPFLGYFTIMDASIALKKPGSFCGLFIDKRGLELLAGAA